MRRKIYYSVGIVLISIAAFIVIGALVSPERLSNLIIKSQKSSELNAELAARELIERDYGISYAYSNNTPGSVGLYIPEYDFITLEQAELYLYFFDIGELIPGETDSTKDGEDDDFYVFRGERGELHINKYYNYIKALYYGTKSKDSASLRKREETLQTQKFGQREEILAQTLEYLENCLLPVNYAESTVTFKDGIYVVTLYSKIGGLINQAHPITVTMDEQNGVLSLDYYQLTYEKIAAVSCISMKEAYYRLPALAELMCGDEGEFAADLKKCTLVYRFEDSILQPAYLFEGEIIQKSTDGNQKPTSNPLSYYVNAAKYY